MKILPDGEKRLTNGFGIMEDLEDIPIDEIMALGLACTAAAGTALVMIEAFNRINMTLDERIRESNQKVAIAEGIMDGQARLLDGVAGVVKESLMVGSLLPDKVG